MIKKVTVAQLKPGMFVHDFNCGWLHHPFLQNRVKIKTDKDIEKIVKHQLREVYIDTSRGLDVGDAPSQEDVVAELQAEIVSVPAAAKLQNPREEPKKTFVKAQHLLSEAKQTTRRLMDDVKLGKQLDLQQVETLVERMTESVLTSKDALISLARIKNKDEYTYMHSLAVSALCVSFGTHLELDAKQVKYLGMGGLVHDIGKVKVPSAILNKPGPLTEQEFAVMKQHVAHGVCVLQQCQFEDGALSVPAHHHERLDGTGYPEGLKGEQISLSGQMAAIIDIYDALTAERCYKKSLPPTYALRKLFEWSPDYVNRKLVESFVAHVGIYPVGSLVRMRSGFLGVVLSHGDQGLLRPVVRVVYDTRKNSRIEPFTIDLSLPVEMKEADEITGCESPERWQLQPEQYLMQ